MRKINSKLPFVGGYSINLAKPVNTALPTISGIVQVGQTLSASTGTWSNSPASWAYQWQNEGSAISGATAATYTLTSGDIGGLITVVVTATNLAGSSVPAISPLAGPTIGATVFYVSQSTGNDSNEGTLAAPWQTIAKVNAQSFAPGTSVLFKRGDVWREQLKLKPFYSGIAGNPIVVDAYGTGLNPIIQGSVSASATTDWTNIGTNLWQSVKTFPPSGGTNGLPYNAANEVSNLLWGLSAAPAPLPAGALFASFGVQTGLAGLAASPTARGQWQFVTAAGPAQWTVQVYSVGNPATAMPGLELAIDQCGIYSNNINYVIYQNLTVQFCGGTGIVLNTGNNMTVRDCIVQWIGGGNLGGAGTRYGDGIDWDDHVDTILIERNFIYQVWDASVGGEGPGVNGYANNVTIRNNILWKMMGAVVNLTREGSGSNTVNGFYVYNNTCYDTTGWALGQRTNGTQDWIVNITSDSFVTISNVFIENNTFAGCSPLVFLLSQYAGFALNGMPMTLDYNNWSERDGSAPYLGVTSVSNQLLAPWAAAFGPPAKEIHGLIQVDPIFTSQSTGNFMPATGSPLQNAGLNLYSNGVVWDFYKQPRPATGPFTIGAIQ